MPLVLAVNVVDCPAQTVVDGADTVTVGVGIDVIVTEWLPAQPAALLTVTW